MIFEIFQGALIESGDLLLLAGEEQPQHLFHPLALKQLQAPGAQSRAFDQESPFFI